MTKAFKALCSLTLCVLFTGQVSAQNLWCNDQINVTVNHQCAIELNVDAFLEGNAVNDPDYHNGLYTFEIYNHTGIIVLGDNTGITFGGGDMSQWVNSLLFYKVYFDDELHCWGTVLLEDKTPPYVECDVCPPINGNSPDDYDPNCVRNCYEQEIIQELWSGYGKIIRIRLENAATQSVVVKHVQMPRNSHHPRGWNAWRIPLQLEPSRPNQSVLPVESRAHHPTQRDPDLCQDPFLASSNTPVPRRAGLLPQAGG